MKDQIKMEIINKIKTIVEPILQREGIELVDIEYQREKYGWVLRIFIFKEGGVSVEDCAYVSEKVSKELDYYDPIPHSYILEVSSPGLDRPLVKINDFKRNVGEKVKVILRENEEYEGKRIFEGRIVNVYNDIVIFEVKGKIVDIPLQKIHHAKIIVEF
ncbi:MAG: ribosome maturation factor RimP [Dictyoglomus sp. NZ13-RE01]|nr:MAG: ribosome maturation factor RimP [Dictyoglomus sp. NZ13-RE01]